MATPALITDAAKHALDGFDNVIWLLESECQSGYRTVESILWVEQRRKLEVWIEDTGALENYQSSLDFHLKDDGNVRSEIGLALTDLCRHLETAYKHLTEEENSDEDPQETFMDDLEPPLQRTRNFVTTSIQCLIQMVLLAKPPAQIDFLKSNEGQDAVDRVEDHFTHLQARFSYSKPQVLERLAWGSSRRHAYLLYRRRCWFNHPSGSQLASDQNDSIPHSSRVRRPSRGSNASAEASNILLEFSFGNTHRPFRCPCCLSDVIVTDKQSKSKHFLNDLKAYVCTVETCSRPRALYATRSEWHSHLRNAHPSLGYGTGKIEDDACPICAQRFDDDRSESAWIRHVASHMQDLALSACPSEARDTESLIFSGDIDTDDSDSDSEDKPTLTENKERSRIQVVTIGDARMALNPPLPQLTSRTEYHGPRPSQDLTEKDASETQQHQPEVEVEQNPTPRPRNPSRSVYNEEGQPGLFTNIETKQSPITDPAPPAHGTSPPSAPAPSLPSMHPQTSPTQQPPKSAAASHHSQEATNQPRAGPSHSGPSHHPPPPRRPPIPPSNPPPSSTSSPKSDARDYDTMPPPPPTTHESPPPPPPLPPPPPMQHQTTYSTTGSHLFTRLRLDQDPSTSSGVVDAGVQQFWDGFIRDREEAWIPPSPGGGGRGGFEEEEGEGGEARFQLA